MPPIVFTRHSDGVGNGARANDVNELQVAIEALGAYSATGDLLVGSATGYPPNRLGTGGTGQVLTVQSDGTLAWANPSTGFTNPMSATGDLIRGGTAGAATRVAIGATNQVLTVVGGVPAWANAASGFTDPETTAGDLIYRNASNVTSRLPAGTATQVLTLAGSPPVPTWAAAAGGMTNPMTTAQDLIVGGTAGAPARLAAGANSQVLTVVSGVVAWANAAAGFANPMTTKGDVIAAATGGTATRLAVGANGQALVADSTQTLGVKWAPYVQNQPLIYHFRRNSVTAGGAGAVAITSTTNYASSMSGTVGPFVSGVTYDCFLTVGIETNAPSPGNIYVGLGFGTNYSAALPGDTPGGERTIYNTYSLQVVGDGITTYTAGLIVYVDQGSGSIVSGTCSVLCHPRS